MATRTSRPAVSSYPPRGAPAEQPVAKIESKGAVQSPPADVQPDDDQADEQADDAVTVDEMPEATQPVAAAGNLALQAFFRTIYRQVMTEMADRLAKLLGLDDTAAGQVMTEVAVRYE